MCVIKSDKSFIGIFVFFVYFIITILCFMEFKSNNNNAISVLENIPERNGLPYLNDEQEVSISLYSPKDEKNNLRISVNLNYREDSLTKTMDFYDSDRAKETIKGLIDFYFRNVPPLDEKK